MRRHWTPCRVCGKEHKNPQSSSICLPCGIAESQENARRAREEREAYEATPLGQFMSLTEDERWERVFERLFGEDAL